MLIKRSEILVAISGAIFFICACIYLHMPYRNMETKEYVGYDEQGHFGMDELDYHFLATNFALANQFPVTGYILDTAIYRIKPNQMMNSIYLNMFRKNGPVTSFMRPPLIPLMIGSVYKIFGYKYYYNLFLNIFLLALISGLMPIVGFSNWGVRGYISGMAGAIIFLKNIHAHWFIHTMGIDVIPTFLFFIVFALGISSERKDGGIYYLVWGISAGFSLLAKPLLTPFLFIVPVYILCRYRKDSVGQGLKKLFAFFAGIFFTLLPWMIYANNMQKITTAERETWCRKVLADTKNYELHNINEVREHPSNSFNGSDPKYDMTIRYFTDIIERLWSYHSRTVSVIFITNSFGDGFLNLNNEYCNDINFHYEWRYIKSSFYRTHCTDSQSAVVKMLLFYCNNPSFLVRIPFSRILYARSTTYHRYFWLAASLWGICVLQLQIYAVISKKMKFILSLLLLIMVLLVFMFSCSLSKYAVVLLFIPLFIAGMFFFRFKYQRALSAVFPIMWLGLFIAIFFMVPNTRYMLVAMPVSCFCIVYFSLLLMKGELDIALGTHK